MEKQINLLIAIDGKYSEMPNIGESMSVTRLR